MRREYPQADIPDEYSLAESILEIYSVTGKAFVILIDEYDVLVREQASEDLFASYLSFLNGLFKSNTVRQAISLAYITGILPVVRDRVQSKLNNFEEYTILDAQELAEFIGFTDQEVQTLCVEHGLNFDECKSWYNGYRQHGFEIYNPQSVVKALSRKKCKSYWSMTSTYQVIAERLRDNFKGTRDSVIRMLAGEEADVRVASYMNTLTDFATRDDVFTYLMHIGYLAYDEENETCRIPNREIWQEWEFAVAVVDEYEETDRIIKASKELLAATIDGDEDAVAKALDESHIHVTSNRSYNNEDALQSAIYLAYLYAINKYTVIREATVGKGFADVVYVPLKETEPAMIIELKRNDCVESAMDQIKEKRYFDSLSHYKGNLLFVGVNYGEKKKTHTCKIEHYVKG
ncbi:MAG: AAA family ATPase [Lachnospiraceae bacterium]|nr:AAA family ATPase [Lachnospiraceae bacterium]